MGFDEIVAQRTDVVDGQLGGGVGVQHGGHVDVFLFQCFRCFNCQQLNVDIGAIQSSTLFRQISYIARVDSIAVNQSGDFHTSILGKVCD